MLLADLVVVELVSRQTREAPGIPLQQRQAKAIMVAVVMAVPPPVIQAVAVVVLVELVVTEQVRLVVLVAQVVHRPLQGQALLMLAAVAGHQEMARDLAALLDQAAVVQAAAHLLKMVVLVQQTQAAGVVLAAIPRHHLQTVVTAAQV